MSSAKETYLTLVADLQLFLLQEYQPKEWIAADRENFHFFRTQAASAPKALPTPPHQPAPANSAPVYPRKPLPPKAPPPPPSVEVKPNPPEKAPFSKEPVGKAAVADLSEMRKLIAEKHPKWEMVEPPPYREKGATVIVFASKGDTLLQSIAQAIQNQLASVQVIDLEQSDATVPKILERPSLRLIVLDEMTLRTNPHLLNHYRPQLGVIGQAPVVVLTDVAQLAHDPQRKRAVWNNIKEKLT